MASHTLYGSNVADATDANACDFAVDTTGGTETNTTSNFTATGWIEIFSQGTSGNTSAGSQPAPSGHGWELRTTLNGQRLAASSVTVKFNQNVGTTSFGGTYHAGFYKKTGSTYAQLGSDGTVTVSGQTSTKTSVTTSTISIPQTDFTSSDVLYLHLTCNITAIVVADTIQIYESTSASTGVAGDIEVDGLSWALTPRPQSDGYGGMFRS